VYSEDEKRINKVLRKCNVSWKVIAEALQKSEDALMTLWARNRTLIELPAKPIISKKKTGGRIGLQIKKLVKEKPQLSVRDLEGEIRSLFPDAKDLPSKSTIPRFLAENKLVVVKLLKRPLVSAKNMQKEWILPRNIFKMLIL
jgi:hypothetical protein